MTIPFDVPSDLQESLAARFSDLGQAAREAFVIERYRNGRFGISVVRRLLGLETRWDAECWLSEHHVPMNYTPEDLESDCRTLDQLFTDKD